MFIIIDWTGKNAYPGMKFESEAQALEFLWESQRNLNPHASDREMDDILAEFYVELA